MSEKEPMTRDDAQSQARRKRVGRRLARVLAIVLLVLGAAVLAVSLYVSRHLGEYKALIIAGIEEGTGRKLAIGKVGLKISLHPTIKIKDVTFGNAAWSHEPVMASADSGTVTFSLAPLLGGHLEVRRIELNKPLVLFEKNQTGHHNWNFGDEKSPPSAPSDASEPGGSSRIVRLRDIDIHDGTFRYLDAAGGRDVSVPIKVLSFRNEGHGETLRIKLEASYQDRPLHLDASLRSLADLVDNQPCSLEATLQSNGTRAELMGTLMRPMDLAGLAFDLRFDAPSGEAIGKLVGHPLSLEGPIRLATHLTDAEETYRADKLEVRVGGSDLAGQVSFRNSSPRPRIEATLASQTVRLSDLLPRRKGKEPAPATEPHSDANRLLSEQPLPLEVLKAVDGKLALQAGHFESYTMALENLDLSLTLQDGLLSVHQAKARNETTLFDATLNVDTRPAPPKLGIELHASGIQLGASLNKLAENEILTGASTDIDITLASRGGSPRALAARLNGQILVRVGEGTIHGKALTLDPQRLIGKLINTFNPFTLKSDLQLHCATVFLPFQQGVAVLDRSIAIETEDRQILGSGSLDLTSEEINLLLKTNNKEGLLDQAARTLKQGIEMRVADLVQITGTLAEPQIRPNPTGILKRGASLYAAIFTGGLSYLAEGLLDSMDTEIDVCETARQQAATAGQGTRKQ